MTVEQVIKATQDLLKNISIPVELIEQIGMPLCGAVNNLQLCLNAFEKDRNAQSAPHEETAEEPEEEPVFADEIGGEENG